MTTDRRRVSEAFDRIRRHASGSVSWVSKVKWRFCKDADAQHSKKWRQFAHAGHYPGVVCFAHAAEKELTDRELLGMSAHEIGHIVAERLGLPAHATRRGQGTSKAIQKEADQVAARMFGLRIQYNRRTLEELVDVSAR